MFYILEVLGAVLIIEGLMPSLFPRFWKKTLTQLADFSEIQLRGVGLLLVLVGALIIKFV